MTATLEETSPYEFFNLKNDATPEEIQEAYLLAVATYRPGSLATYTLVSEEEREKTLGRIEKAYQVLCDPAQRQKHDLHLSPHNSDEAPHEVRVQGQKKRKESQEKPHKHKILWSRLALLLSWIRRPPTPQPQLVRLHPQSHDSSPVERESSLSSGRYLQYVRKMRGLTLETISDDTKISKRYLEALEGEEYGKLPQGVYLTYILGAYAKALSLDAKSIVQDFSSRQS